MSHRSFPLNVARYASICGAIARLRARLSDDQTASRS
jgi:hypothetical protein